jgi:hypothetical protein
LSSAADAKGQKSKNVDKMFQRATSLLCYYEWRSRFRNLNEVEYIKSDNTLFKRLEEARSKDKSVWARILLNLRKKVRLVLLHPQFNTVTYWPPVR